MNCLSNFYNFPSHPFIMQALPEHYQTYFKWRDLVTQFQNSSYYGKQHYGDCYTQIFPSLHEYWWWDTQIQQNVNACDNFAGFINLPTSACAETPEPQKIKTRRRKKNLPSLDEKLAVVMGQISSGEITGFKGCPKSMKGMYRNKSGRRSRFIGVSKNSQNWQVLINLGDFKKYIGTYSTEKEAAIAYDFYSIILNGYKANTNFSYNLTTVMDMINSYKANDRTFVPTDFMFRV